MRTIRLVSAALVMTACASGSTGDHQSTQETVSISSADGRVDADLRLTRDRFVGEAEVAGAREDVWSLLPDAFHEVGLPEPALDRSTWTAVVQDHVVRRRLGSQRLSRLLDCGRGITQPHADSHRIHLTVSVRLEEGSEEGQTAVRTSVSAVAENPEGTTGASRCSTRGELERLLANAIHLQVLDR